MGKFFKRTMGWLPARFAVGILAWFGFFNLFMTRINISVAIVAMVKHNASGNGTSLCELQAQESTNGTLSRTSADGNHQNQLHDPDPDDLASQEDQMMWDDMIKGLVLGAFYYGYCLTQIIGGRMAEIHGTKIVFGSCILASGIIAILSPTMARLHYGALIAVRILQGAFQGVSWPSMHACIARWIPPLERPRFIAIVYMATSLSSAITMQLVGAIIARHGWAAQFYIVGGLSLIWCCVWYFLMYDTPEEHPRISREELNFIQKAVKESGTNEIHFDRAPWRKILTSPSVWALIAFTTGNHWGITIFFTILPSYFKSVLGFSIQSNGIVSALPLLCRYLGAIIWSAVGSWFLSRKYLSIRSTRRMFAVIALWCPGAVLVGVIYAGCQMELLIALLCLALFFNGAISVSGLVNQTDISPNFAGTLFGIDNTWGSVISFIAPVVNGAILKQQESLHSWQWVFWLCIPFYFICGIIFLIFVSGEVQPWNDPDSTKSSSPDETQNEPLTKDDHGEEDVL